MLQHYTRGPANETVVVIEMRPCSSNRIRILMPVERFELMTQLPNWTRSDFDFNWRGGFTTGVCHAIQTGLNSPSADRKIHRAVLRMNDRVSHRQRCTRKKFFPGCRVACAIRFQMHGVDLAPAPVENKQSLLIFGRELRSIAKCRTRRRSWSDVERRGQIVRIKFRVLSSTIAPAEFRSADHMIHSSWTIPWRVEVVFHVRIVGE